MKKLLLLLLIGFVPVFGGCLGEVDENEDNQNLDNEQSNSDLDNEQNEQALSEERDSARLSHLGQTSMALSIYYSGRGRGSYPESDGMVELSEIQDYLVPRYMDSLPSDPLDGKNYYYISLNNRGTENGGYALIAELENTGDNGYINANNIDEVHNMIKGIDSDSSKFREILEDSGNYYLSYR
ncbi:hypothetical protein [Candidatus Vampirococcus lugosii]|uniref:Uncharacterized protein n=1 Tax=Candidatus Vampirococcus lugosii TaxID=2789015 RepID=A0ABS5QMS8_9BACT|nr:hypothetical protein [Candidatus Vampirococcus lugosii]MBS8122521.1 hypothetical protein [Candidatus Vampirococcus lugosii]